MTVLILAEKSSLALVFAQYIHKIGLWEDEEIIILSTNLSGFYQFKWPKGLTSKDFPCCIEPDYQLKNRGNHKSWPIWIRRANYSLKPESSHSSAIMEDLGFIKDNGFGSALIGSECTAVLAELLNKSRLILMGVDGGYSTSTMAVVDILKSVGNQTYDQIRSKVVDARIMFSFSDVENVIKNCADEKYKFWNPNTDPMVSYGTARRFFDYNFLINARALLAPVIKRSGLKQNPGEWLLSKYSIQLLFYISRVKKNQCFSDGSIIHEMGKIKGTGKYPKTEDGMGSSMSKHVILENLIKLELLERTDEKLWVRNFSIVADIFAMNHLEDNDRFGVRARNILALEKFNAVVNSCIENNNDIPDYTVFELFQLLTVEIDPSSTKKVELNEIFKQAMEIAQEKNLWNHLLDKEILFELKLIRFYQISSKISDKGWKFISLLPKTACDPDLHFRVDLWSKDWPNSRKAMESYIKRYFGSIKRSNGMEDIIEDSGYQQLISQQNTSDLIADEEIMEKSRNAQISFEATAKVSRGEPITRAQTRALLLADIRDRSKKKP